MRPSPSLASPMISIPGSPASTGRTPPSARPRAARSAGPSDQAELLGGARVLVLVGVPLDQPRERRRGRTGSRRPAGERLDAPGQLARRLPARRCRSPPKPGFPAASQRARSAALKNAGGPSVRTMRPDASLAIQISWLEVCRALKRSPSLPPTSLANAPSPLTYQYWPGPITGAGSPATSLAAAGAGARRRRAARCRRRGRRRARGRRPRDERRRQGEAPRRTRAAALARAWSSTPRAGRRGWLRGRVGLVVIRILSGRRAAPTARGRRACVLRRE